MSQQPPSWHQSIEFEVSFPWPGAHFAIIRSTPSHHLPSEPYTDLRGTWFFFPMSRVFDWAIFELILVTHKVSRLILPPEMLSKPRPTVPPPQWMERLPSGNVFLNSHIQRSCLTPRLLCSGYLTWFEVDSAAYNWCPSKKGLRPLWFRLNFFPLVYQPQEKQIFNSPLSQLSNASSSNHIRLPCPILGWF